MGNINIINRKLNFNYNVIETLECGMQLTGNEVKSIRAGKANINEAWITIENGELFIKGMHITKWDTINAFSAKADENRPRKLLAHKKEIDRLNGKNSVEGYTIVPSKIYFTNGKCKILIALAKGKHNYDKRESLKIKQAKRDAERALKNNV